MNRDKPITLPESHRRIRRLAMQLNEARVYMCAMALESKTLDTIPDGFRHSMRDVIAHCDDVLEPK